MNFNINRVKIVTMAPADQIDHIRQAVCHAGAGVIGNYSFCTYTTTGTGTFYPNANTQPHIGDKQTLNQIPETRLEFICAVAAVKPVIQALRTTHPYEEPEIDIFPLLDEDQF